MAIAPIQVLSAPGPQLQASTERAADESLLEITLTLEAMDYPTYEALLEAATQSATAAIERSFTDSLRWAVVRVNILGTHGGTIVPLLTVQVPRESWQSYPNVEQWGRWLGSASQQLLDFQTGSAQSSRIAEAGASADAAVSISRGRGGRVRRFLSSQ
jgi:hypothetical protein